MSAPAVTRTRPPVRKQRESWGSATKLPSGRVRARYTGPDLATHNASTTFDALDDAREWLRSERRLIDAGAWTPPHLRYEQDVENDVTLRAYANAWLPKRRRHGKDSQPLLAPRTKNLYRGVLDREILPSLAWSPKATTPLGDQPLRLITDVVVRAWYLSLDEKKATQRVHAYSLLHEIMDSAVEDKLILSNPLAIRGAGTTLKRKKKIVPATAEELQLILDRIPDRYMVFVLLGVWCAMRFGELIELRRKDLNLKKAEVSITRAAGKIKDENNPGHMLWVVGPPKSEAGIRDVSMPAFLVPIIEHHLATVSQPGKEGLVFPAAQSGSWMEHGGFFETWDKARNVAGRPDLRLHDLRHTGAVLAARNGATIAELMARLGHTTPEMAMRYQHASRDRDRELAAGLNAMALAGKF